MEQQANCYEEAECGCYAKDEEIPIEEDKCILNLGTFPDVDGWWKFTFELKINSLPKDGDFAPDSNRDWSFNILSIAFDGYNSVSRPGYPSHLTYYSYQNTRHYGKALFNGNTNSLMMQPHFSFQEGQWYKFTVTGKPIGSDGQIMWNDWRDPDQKPARCQIHHLIEGPGTVGNKGKYTFTANHASCLKMQEGFPLKVFGAKQVLSGLPMDGVLRNIVFENTATDTSIDTTC